MNSILFIALACSSFIGTACSSTWDYTSPGTWYLSYPECGYNKQSPIDIETNKVEVDEALGMFTRDIFSQQKFAEVTFQNNGHSVQVDVDSATSYTIKDDSLFSNGKGYKLAQYHLHWASSSIYTGSEHTIDGKQYFGELHLVHYNTDYSSLADAVDEDEGLAVLGFFIEADATEDNLDFNRAVMNWLYAIGTSGTSVEVTGTSETFSMGTILPPDLSTYYRYHGSLTTPSCYESVIWTVFKDTIKISADQANSLTTSLAKSFGKSSGSIVNNYRPVQPLNDRKVYKPMPFVQQPKSNSQSSISPLMLYFFSQMSNPNFDENHDMTNLQHEFNNFQAEFDEINQHGVIIPGGENHGP